MILHAFSQSKDHKKEQIFYVESVVAVYIFNPSM